MIKRIAIRIVCAVLLMTMLCVTASAKAETVDFSLIANDAGAGEQVIVTVSIPADSYFTNATMLLHYDPAAVTYVTDSVAGGAISPASAWVMGNDFTDKGYVKVAYVTIDGITAGGELMTFEFTSKNGAPAAFSLTFEECVGVDENGVEFDVQYTSDPIAINNNGETLPSAPVATTATLADSDNDGKNTVVLLIVAGVTVVVIAGVTVVMLAVKKKKS